MYVTGMTKSNLTVMGHSKSRNKESRNERRGNGFPAHVLILMAAIQPCTHAMLGFPPSMWPA